jgi:hypothetical protein
MSHFESTSGSEGVLKAQTEPFPVLESRARLFCELPPRRARFARVSGSCARGRQGKSVRLVYPVFYFTAGLGAKEVRRQGSGGSGRRKVARRVRELRPLMKAVYSCAPGEERFSLQLLNAGGQAAAPPAI